jgi:hypothetical protein
MLNVTIGKRDAPFGGLNKGKRIQIFSWNAYRAI